MNRTRPHRTGPAGPPARPRRTWWRRAIALERLPVRWRALTHELAKFGTIGVINLFVNFAVLNLLILTVLQNGELKAKAIAAIVATTSAYFMNRHWTYRDRPKSTLRREYSLFFFFNLVGMVIEVAVVGFAKYGLHQTHLVAVNISTAIGIALGTLFRFWAYRTHVFKTDFGGTGVDSAPDLAASPDHGAPDPGLAVLSAPHAVSAAGRGSSMPSAPASPVAAAASDTAPTGPATAAVGSSTRDTQAAPAVGGSGEGTSAAIGAGDRAPERDIEPSSAEGTVDEIELDGMVTLAELPAESTS